MFACGVRACVESKLWGFQTYLFALQCNMKGTSHAVVVLVMAMPPLEAVDEDPVPMTTPQPRVPKKGETPPVGTQKSFCNTCGWCFHTDETHNEALRMESRNFNSPNFDVSRLTCHSCGLTGVLFFFLHLFAPPTPAA